MILQWENIDYGMGLDPQIWYNCEHKLTTPKMSEPIFEACFEHVHWMALLQTRCRKRTPHGRAEAGRRPAEGRLRAWSWTGWGRPKAGRRPYLRMSYEQVLTSIASLKQKSWKVIRTKFLPESPPWSKSHEFDICEIGGAAYDRAIQGWQTPAYDSVWPAYDPHLTPAIMNHQTLNLPHTQPGVCKIKCIQKPGPVKILKSHTKHMTFGSVLMQSHTRFKVSDAKKS